MPRRATGGVVTRQGRTGTSYSSRLHARNGRREYLTLASADGWTRARAEAELANVSPM